MGYVMSVDPESGLLMVLGALVLCWVLVTVVLPWWEARQRPEDNRWWPVVQTIERIHPHDATLSFRAREARLVWHAVQDLRGGQPRELGYRVVELQGLWRTHAGHWFYMDTFIDYPRLLESLGDSPSHLHDVFLELLSPRRAYNVLLAHSQLLAREFPRGRPPLD